LKPKAIFSVVNKTLGPICTPKYINKTVYIMMSSNNTSQHFATAMLKS